MLVYAISMCLQTPRPNIGRACTLVTTHPMRPPLGVSYEQSAITSLAECRREIKLNGKPIRGYEYICLSKEVPMWERPR
jgi:hypothetical protein